VAPPPFVVLDETDARIVAVEMGWGGIRERRRGHAGVVLSAAMSRSLFRAAAILLAVCAALGGVTLALVTAAAPQTRFTGRVIGVTDGDTISVLTGGRAVKVRLEGIDCPELEQPYGRVAKQFTSDRAFGRLVDVTGTTTDRYGRLIGRVVVNGEDLSLTLIAAGLAWHYTEYSSDRQLAAAEQAARRAHAGLWSQRDPVPPWVARRAPSAASSAASRASPAPVTSSGPYHGNVRSKVFHKPGCPNYDCKQCTAVFATRAEAIAHGYKPAGCCKP
jgi:micrococcal nuclease